MANRQPRVVETCPECKLDFMCPPVLRTSERGILANYKQCPNGHWTPTWRLAKSRRGTAPTAAIRHVVPTPPKNEAPLAPKATLIPTSAKPAPLIARVRSRQARVVTEREEHLELALVALIEAHDKLNQQARPGSQLAGMIEGVFGKTVSLARQMLEAP